MQESVFTPSQQEHTPSMLLLATGPATQAKTPPKTPQQRLQSSANWAKVKNKRQKFALVGTFVHRRGENQPGGDNVSKLNCRSERSAKADGRKHKNTLFSASSPCLTHLRRTGSLLCLTTAWTSLVVSPATGVSLTSSRSSSGLSWPLAPAALPAPISGNWPFSAPPCSSSPGPPSSLLPRTLSWTLLVQWFFLFLRLLDMARANQNHMSAAEEVGSGRRARPWWPRRANASPFSGERQMCPCQRAHTSHVPQLDHLDLR